MPEDDLASLSRFETLESDEATANNILESLAGSADDTLNAFIDLPAQLMFKDMVLLLEAEEVFKKANAKGGREQPVTQEISNVEQALLIPNSVSTLVVDASVEKSSDVNTSEKKVTDDEPLFKKLKFLLPTPSSILSPTPLNTILPLTLPKDLTPPRDESKGKGIATEEHLKEIIPFMEEGGSVPKMPNFMPFSTPDGQMTNDDVIAQLKEMKRLADLKAKTEKSEKSLKKILNPAKIMAQKMAKVNSSKEATMGITRGNDPLNLTVYERFKLKTLRFCEWLEVHALASKIKGKLNDLLLQSLRAKFQWVLSKVKALDILPPPDLSTFGVSISDKKIKKSSETLTKVFVNENVVVDGMHRNLIPPLRAKGRKGLVIREPESGVFFNGNFDLVFQQEEEFPLATTPQLIRL
ncbi:hypothetical protein Tco_1218478 [Tanacetum coccineum]